jgi:hypothetical protein
MLFRRAFLALALANLTATSAGAQSYTLDYDASLGTLPSAQGWVHFVDDPLPDDSLDETNYTVSAGVLTQGPTGGGSNDDANRQWYEAPAPDFDFDDDVIEIDLRLKIVSSTMTPPPAGGPRAGFGVQLEDSDGEMVAVYIGDTGFFLYGKNGSTSGLLPQDTTASFFDYRLRVDSYGASIWFEGDEEAYLPRSGFGSPSSGTAVLIGDVTTIERSSSELESFRFARFNPAVAEVRNLAFVTQFDALGNPNSIQSGASCPGGNRVISGGARIFSSDPGLHLAETDPLLSTAWSTGAQRWSGPGLDWQLESAAICGEVPGYWQASNFNGSSATSKSFSVDCFESKTVIGGGASAFAPSFLPPLSLTAPSAGPGTGWDGAATYTGGGTWTLSVDAICSDARGWTVATASTAIDGSSPKSIGATCPIGTVAVGGGTRITGTPAGTLRLQASHPEELINPDPVIWFGEAITSGAWGLEVTAFCAPTAEPTITRHALGGRWRADSGFPVDEKGLNDGTLLNGASIVAGLNDQAFELERVNEEWVSIPGDDFYPVRSFSVDAWFETDSLAAGEPSTIVELYDFGGIGSGNFSYWALRLTADDGFAQGIARPASSSGTPGVTGSVGLADGEPHHMAVVRDVDQLRVELYVDGAFVGFFSLTPNNNDGPFHPGTPGSPDPVAIGVHRPSQSTDLIREWDGLVDDVKFYDRALTAEEIENTAGCGVPIVPRVLNVDAARFGGPATIPNDHKLCVYLEAGDYDLELVSSVEQAAARFTGWAASGSNPELWGTAYSVVGDIIATGGGIPLGEVSGQAAFDATANKTISFNLATDQQIYIGIEDDLVLDNQGGVSLLLTVPEPGVPVGLLAGVGLLALLGRRRRSA